MNDAFVLAVIAAFLGGSIPVAAKIALEVFQPFTLVFIRFLTATLFLLPFIWKSGGLKMRSLRTFIPVGIVGAINPILLFIALQYTQASVAPLIYAAIPAMNALYFYFVKNDRLDTKQILGIILGLFGVSLVVILPLIEKHTSLAALRGNILIFGATLAFMIYGIISKSLQKKMNATPVMLTFYFCLVSLVVSIPFAYFEIAQKGFLSSVEPKHILSGIYTGIMGTGLFYVVYQYALQISSEVTASLFTYLQPIATILLAILLLGDKITIPFLIGGFLAIAGARLASKK